MLRKKIILLLSTVFLCTSLTACGNKNSGDDSLKQDNYDDTEYAQDSNPDQSSDKNTDTLVSEVTDVDKHVQKIISQFEKDFSHLNMKKTEKLPILMMTDTVVKEMGIEYKNYLTAYSVPNYETQVVNDIFAASLEVSKSKEFNKDEPLVKAIFNGLNTLGVNPFTEAEGLANELSNAVLALNNIEYYEIALNENLYMAAEEKGSTCFIIVGAKKSSPMASNLLPEVTNFDSYDEYESMILSLNENYKSVLATATGVNESEVLQSTPDPTNSQIYLNDSDVIDIGFSRTIYDDFTTEVNVKITNFLDKRDSVLDSVISFIEDNFKVQLNLTGKDLIATAISYDEGVEYMNNLHSPLHSSYNDNLFNIICPNTPDPFSESIDWRNPYLDYLRVYDDNELNFRFNIKVNVEGKETR